MQDITLTVTLKLAGPILTHSTAPCAAHLSSPFARDSNGNYYFPGSLVKGRLREAWAELESAAGPFLETRCGLTLEQLLGEESGNQQNNGASTKPKRGRLHFDHFKGQSRGAINTNVEPVRYRIKLDEVRGSIEKGAYEAVEAPYASGEEASFVGYIHFRAGDIEFAQKVTECVRIGLRWVTNLGANCNIGFGRLLDVTVTDIQGSPDVEPATAAATGADHFTLSIRPLSPFCISRRRVADNLFESESIIPGAVLKGSLAHTWRTLRGDDPDGEIGPGYDPVRPDLCEHFHLVRFTHAFPADQGRQSRPVTPPLSLVRAHDRLYDVAFFSEPILIGRKNPTGETEWSAPRFAIDWKANEHSYAQDLFGWANPKRELRVRTAIDAVRRKAKDEQLFAYEMIVPDGIAWLASVDLSAIADGAVRSKVESQLVSLLAYGLRGIGKTKARAEVDVSAASASSCVYSSEAFPITDSGTQGRSWIVTLQTPAIISDPEIVNGQGLFEAYRQAWDQVSASAIELEHYFACQSLSGGYYIYRRFMTPDEYYPYLLTEPGSVFKLRSAAGKDSEAEASIRSWLSHGLPLPDWAVRRFRRDGLPGDDWRNCPYLREGGYGEIAVNLAVHTDPTHQPQEVKEL